MMRNGMDKSNELLVCASRVIDAHVLDVPREKLPDVVKVPGLLGVQLSLTLESVHILACPSDPKITVTTTVAVS